MTVLVLAGATALTAWSALEAQDQRESAEQVSEFLDKVYGLGQSMVVFTCNEVECSDMFMGTVSASKPVDRIVLYSAKIGKVSVVLYR